MNYREEDILFVEQQIEKVMKRYEHLNRQLVRLHKRLEALKNG